MKRTYYAKFDCGNDIVTVEIKAGNLSVAKMKAQQLKKKDFDNDRKIKTSVSWRP